MVEQANEFTAETHSSRRMAPLPTDYGSDIETTCAEA
jgi:hypothetical protein